MHASDTIVRLTNCVQAVDGDEVTKDLYISTTSGKIIEQPPQGESVPTVHDLGGRILAPGLIEVQLNGALGFTFSEVPGSDAEMGSYVKSYQETCRGLIRTGVTSFLPTLTTGTSESFKRVSWLRLSFSSTGVSCHDDSSASLEFLFVLTGHRINRLCRASRPRGI